MTAAQTRFYFSCDILNRLCEMTIYEKEKSSYYAIENSRIAAANIPRDSRYNNPIPVTRILRVLKYNKV